MPLTLKQHMLLSDMNIKANEGEAPDKVLGLMYKLLSMLTKVPSIVSKIQTGRLRSS